MVTIFQIAARHEVVRKAALETVIVAVRCKKSNCALKLSAPTVNSRMFALPINIYATVVEKLKQNNGTKQKTAEMQADSPFPDFPGGKRGAGSDNESSVF